MKIDPTGRVLFADDPLTHVNDLARTDFHGPAHFTDTGWHSYEDVGRQLEETGGLFDFIGDAISTITKPVTSIVGAVAKPVLGAVSTIASPILKPVMGAVGTVLKPVGDVVGGVLKPVGGVLGDVLKPVGSVLDTVGKPLTSVLQPIGKVLDNPLFDMARTGVSFIPGVGTAVSAGLGALAAAGRGASLSDMALEAAKSAIPGGPAVKAAVDIGLGAMQGRNVSDQVLEQVRSQLPGGELAKAAFDAATAIGKGQHVDQAALAAIQSRVPGGEAGRQVFRQVVDTYNANKTPGGAPVAFPHLPAPIQRLTATMQRMGRRAIKLPTKAIARETGYNEMDCRRAMAAFLNRSAGSPVVGWQNVGELDSMETAALREQIQVPIGDFDAGEMTFDKVKVVPKLNLKLPQDFVQKLYDQGGANIKKALLAHGLLARVAQQTGELDGKGGWIIKSGDTGFGIAKKVTGDGNRWREIIPVNPGMSTYTDKNGATQIKPWQIGQRISLPPSWLGSATPLPAPLPIPTSIPTSLPSSIPTSLPSSIPQLPQSTSLPASVGRRQYTVVKGDTMFGIAKRFTGDGNRWKELHAENPQVKDPNVIVVGQKLFVPPTWPDLPGVTTTPTATTIPLPVPGAPAIPSHSPEPTIGAIQTMLAFFYQKHGQEVPTGLFSSSSVPTFGQDPDDFSGVWTDRCLEATQGFQGWSNAHPRPGVTPLTVNGDMDQPTLAALQVVNAQDLATITGTPVPSPTSPTLPPIISSQLPTSIPLPGGGPVAIPSSIPTSIPSSIPTQVPTQLPTQLPSGLPTSLPTVPGATAPTATQASATGGKSSNTMLWVAAAAAAILLFGKRG